MAVRLVVLVVVRAVLLMWLAVRVCRAARRRAHRFTARRRCVRSVVTRRLRWRVHDGSVLGAAWRQARAAAPLLLEHCLLEAAHLSHGGAAEHVAAAPRVREHVQLVKLILHGLRDISALHTKPCCAVDTLACAQFRERGSTQRLAYMADAQALAHLAVKHRVLFSTAAAAAPVAMVAHEVKHRRLQVVCRDVARRAGERLMHQNERIDAVGDGGFAGVDGVDARVDVKREKVQQRDAEKHGQVAARHDAPGVPAGGNAFGAADVDSAVQHGEHSFVNSIDNAAEPRDCSTAQAWQAWLSASDFRSFQAGLAQGHKASQGLMQHVKSLARSEEVIALIRRSVGRQWQTLRNRDLFGWQYS